MKLHSTVAVFAICAMLLISKDLQAQNQKDPFSTADATTAKSVPKKSKTIIDIETLDHCMEWFEISYSIANMKAEIHRHNTEIKSPANQESLTRAKTRRIDLLNRITLARRELDRIPLATTFDLQRFEQFKNQLKQIESNHYEQLVTPAINAAATIRELEQENKQLRQEIRELKSNKK